MFTILLWVAFGSFWQRSVAFGIYHGPIWVVVSMVMVRVFRMWSDNQMCEVYATNDSVIS